MYAVFYKQTPLARNWCALKKVHPDRESAEAMAKAFRNADAFTGSAVVVYVDIDASVDTHDTV